MARCETFEADWKFDVRASDNVLDLEISELGIETKLLDDAGIFARCQFGIILAFCAGHNHFTRCEDKCSRLGFTNTHDDSSKTLGCMLMIDGRECSWYRDAIPSDYTQHCARGAQSFSNPDGSQD